MRVTDMHMLNQYLNNNNLTLSAYMRRQNRVLTQKDFLRASENSVKANTAMKIRKQLENIEMYDENLKTAGDLFTVAETNLYKISGDIYNTVNEKLVSIQSTKGPVEFEAIGEEIMQNAEEMLKIMNADMGDRQLFGGTSNNKQPFTVKYFKTNELGDIKMFKVDENYQANGKMHYRDTSGNIVVDRETGIPIKIEPDPQDGKYYIPGSKDALPANRLEEAWDYEYATEHEKNSDGNYLYYYKDPTSGAETRYYRVDNDYYEVSTKVKLEDPAITPQPVMKKTPVEADKDSHGGYVANGKRIESMQADIYDSLKTKRAIVYYHGEEINKYNDYKEFNASDGIYIDIGIGIKYDETGAVIPATAMDIALHGSKLTGCGIDKCDGYGDSNNIIQLAFDAARAAYNGGDTSTKGMETCNRLIDKLSAAQKTMLSGIAELGIKQNSIEFHIGKNVDYTLNLSENQNEVEGVDLTKEITNLTAAQAAYNAALRMSSTAVPKSLFDFI